MWKNRTLLGRPNPSARGLVATFAVRRQCRFDLLDGPHRAWIDTDQIVVHGRAVLDQGGSAMRVAVTNAKRAFDKIGQTRRSGRGGRSDQAWPCGGTLGACRDGRRSRGAQEAPRGDKIFRGRQSAGRKKPRLPFWTKWFASVIAVDTSALMAIALGEKEADACIRFLETETQVVISARTVAEALIVAAWRNVGEEVIRLIDALGFEIVSMTPASARRIAAAYARWVRGAHPAGLNFGDCFPTKSPRNAPALCSMLVMIFRKPIWKALSRGGFRHQAAAPMGGRQWRSSMRPRCENCATSRKSRSAQRNTLRVPWSSGLWWPTTKSSCVRCAAARDVGTET